MAKILLVHHSGSIGGGSLSLYTLAKMLSEKHEVIVYCPDNPRDFSNFLESKGILSQGAIGDMGTISAYSGGPSTYRRTFIKGLSRIPKTRNRLKDVIKNEKPDIVAVNSMVLSWAGKSIQKLGAKSICFVRETATRSLWTSYIRYFLNTFFDGVFFISEYDQNKFKLKKPLSGVVKDCISLEDYNVQYSRAQACEQLNINPKNFNVLFAGGTSQLKGWQVIRKAMEEIDDDNIKLIVAGYNNFNTNHQQKNIEFLGIRSDMPLIYRACDVLVFPSTKPHQSRPIFEAGVFKLPAIASDFTQTDEHIRNQYNGITFAPNSSTELANAIKLLANNEILRSKLGENNYYNTLKHHEYNSNKEAMLNYIDMILEKK